MVGRKKHSSDSGPQDTHQLARFLWPSWNGACAYLYISLAVVAALVAVSHFDGNFIAQHLNTWNIAVERSSSSDPYGAYPDNPSGVEDSIQVLLGVILWGSAAALFYFFIAGVTHAVRNPVSQTKTRKSAHAQPFHIVASVFIHVIIRGLALCLLLLGIVVFIKIIINYVLAATYLAGGDTSWLEAACAILLSFVLLVAGMHMLAVLLRLFLFKPRLLHNNSNDR
jgi:uncharacterized membrane protein